MGLITLAVVVALVTSSCSWVSGWFHDDDGTEPTSVSVFDARVGDCFVALSKPTVTLADLSKVPCDVEHQQEMYAVVAYDDPNVSAGTTTIGLSYPGKAALDTFAKGACAEKFAGYVGIAYQDSGLWMTYLMPSARSWQQDNDRSVLCFVTTTGKSLTKSVKGSKL